MTSKKYWILAVAAGICVVVILAVKIRRDTSGVGKPGADEAVKQGTTKEGTGGPPRPPRDADPPKVDTTSDTVEPAVAKAFNRTSHKGYSSIQSAIDNATDGDVIEVAAGTHYESIDFKGKSITVRSFDPDDWEVVEKTVIDANGDGEAVDFHNSEDANSVLKGFKITGGDSAGIYCNGASPTIGNCLITGNGKNDEGGGMYNSDGASPNMMNCVFSNNAAEFGGGMYNDESSPTVIYCVFHHNKAKDDGGGMYNDDESSPTIINCTFTKNKASTGDGGAMYNASSSPTVTNCVLYDNLAEEHGGGMYNDDESSPTIINCTFTENEAEESDGGGMYNDDSDADVTNCIFWRNTAEDDGDEIYNNRSEPTFSYCCIRGGLNGSRCGGDDSTNDGGNIDEDPKFYNR
jgi:hypothetical protein